VVDPTIMKSLRGGGRRKVYGVRFPAEHVKRPQPGRVTNHLQGTAFYGSGRPKKVRKRGAIRFHFIAGLPRISLYRWKTLSLIRICKLIFEVHRDFLHIAVKGVSGIVLGTILTYDQICAEKTHT
jgi:hypothetical protein